MRVGSWWLGVLVAFVAVFVEGHNGQNNAIPFERLTGSISAKDGAEVGEAFFLEDAVIGLRPCQTEAGPEEENDRHAPIRRIGCLA